MVLMEIRQVGKASDFDSDMHRFESCISYQFLSLQWVGFKFTMLGVM